MTARAYTIPKHVSDRDLNFLEQHSAEYDRADRKCPTCAGTGTYRYDGEDHVCPRDEHDRDLQFRLFKLYCMADIPYQYQTLDWNDYPHDSVGEFIDNYIDKFDDFAAYGIGLEIYGRDMATGKSWAATHVLRELVKMGKSGWFVTFNDIRAMWEVYDEDEQRYRTARILKSAIVVIDEISPAISNQQRHFFEDKLEWVIRHRTNRNLPTITTSNSSPEELIEQFPRIHSLLAAKQRPVELRGDDYRIKSAFASNIALADLGERVLIT